MITTNKIDIHNNYTRVHTPLPESENRIIAKITIYLLGDLDRGGGVLDLLLRGDLDLSLLCRSM